MQAGGDRRPNGQGASLDAAIRDAAHNAPGGANQRRTYRVAEIRVDVTFRSPGEIGVYRVELEEV